MSALITPATVVRHIAPIELAQLADRGATVLVSGPLLAATIAEGDLSEWTEDEQTAAAAAVEVIEGACEVVTGLIESHLTLYALPLTSVPAAILLCGVDLVRHRLQVGQQGGQVTEATQRQHDYWMKWLDRVAEDDVKLGLTPAGEATARVDNAHFLEGDRTFSADCLADYK